MPPCASISTFLIDQFHIDVRIGSHFISIASCLFDSLSFSCRCIIYMLLLCRLTSYLKKGGCEPFSHPANQRQYWAPKGSRSSFASHGRSAFRKRGKKK